MEVENENVVDLTDEDTTAFLLLKIPEDSLKRVSKLVKSRKKNAKKKMQKRVRVKGNWTAEEDSKLLVLVRSNGAKKWSQLALQMDGRIGKQCRERWLNHLDPKINKKDWSKNEDGAIFRLHEIHGNQWSKISKDECLSGRTPNMIKNRWNSTLKRQVSGDSKYKSRKRKKRNSIPPRIIPSRVEPLPMPVVSADLLSENTDRYLVDPLMRMPNSGDEDLNFCNYDTTPIMGGDELDDVETPFRHLSGKKRKFEGDNSLQPFEKRLKLDASEFSSFNVGDINVDSFPSPRQLGTPILKRNSNDNLFSKENLTKNHNFKKLQLSNEESSVLSRELGNSLGFLGMQTAIEMEVWNNQNEGTTSYLRVKMLKSPSSLKDKGYCIEF